MCFAGSLAGDFGNRQLVDFVIRTGVCKPDHHCDFVCGFQSSIHCHDQDDGLDRQPSAGPLISSHEGSSCITLHTCQVIHICKVIHRVIHRVIHKVIHICADVAQRCQHLRLSAGSWLPTNQPTSHSMTPNV